jgi:hypothetical protein
MIVWGGENQNPGAGGRYDPIADTWASTSLLGVPPARFWHTAVWTGEVMVVWGGAITYTGHQQSGGRYDPVADAWSPTSLVNAPDERYAHTAVWTGRLMMLWGGVAWPDRYTGGRYSVCNDDGDGDGLSVCAGDCEDTNADVYPGAVEMCDSLDNDCDGLADEAILHVAAGERLVGPGSRHPTTAEPLDGMVVRLYDRSDGSCIRAACGGVGTAHYPCIAGSGCPASAEGVTDADGLVSFELPPGDYFVLGRGDDGKLLGVQAPGLFCGTEVWRTLRAIRHSRR